jgi:predicted dehydrogenase
MVCAIDAVAFATPHSQHAEQVIQAAAAGKHVFVEKPLALTGHDARRAADAAKAAGVVLAVGFNLRFNPSMKLLRETIREGKLGVISSIMAEQAAISGLSLAAGNWRGDPLETPGAALTATGIHPLDGMIELMGRVKRVYCVNSRRACKSDDTTNVMLTFANGVTGQLFCSIAVTPTNRMAAFGTLASPKSPITRWKPSRSCTRRQNTAIRRKSCMALTSSTQSSSRPRRECR